LLKGQPPPRAGAASGLPARLASHENINFVRVKTVPGGSAGGTMMGRMEGMSKRTEETSSLS